MWEKNREVLGNRFPRVLAALESTRAALGAEWMHDAPALTLRVNGIQLTGARDRIAEAREQANLIPEDSKAAWVYGLGLGDLARELLARPLLEQLTVVLFHPGLARVVMDRVDFGDWLRDERVELVLACEQSELRSPFAALPGELILADDESARFRDLVQHELAAPWVAARMEDRRELFTKAIQGNLASIVRDGDVAELFDSAPGETIFVAAAGPSLEESYELLRNRSGSLICVGAAMRPLLGAELRPEIVVSIDGHPDGMRKHFTADLSKLSESTLVYFPVIPPNVLAEWQGRKLVAYGTHPRWSQLQAEVPKGELWGAGTVTHVAVDLAVRMGASRVVLLGCDFGFPGGRTHARGNAYSRKSNQPAGVGTWVHDVHGNRLSTLPNLCGYLRDLERFIALHPEVDFVNASQSGARIIGTQTLEEASLGI